MFSEFRKWYIPFSSINAIYRLSLSILTVAYAGVYATTVIYIKAKSLILA